MGKCYNSTVVDASIDEVWEMIKDFHQLSWGDKVITKVDIVGEVSGTEVGAKRILNEAFHETLLSVDNKNFSFTYSIDDGPGPVSKDSVSNYVGKVFLYPITDSGKTFVEWISTYDSDSDSAVGDFCNPIYAGLLSSLKSKF
ncbi:MAG: SRPBCC family protein [Proteobacteria bacterium]|nr:SRPBCC family protein [Pseudomonadota bacterium]